LEKRNRLLNLKSQLLSVERQIQERLRELERESKDSTMEHSLSDSTLVAKLQTPSDSISIDFAKGNDECELEEVDELEF
jgi:hypothetical protein